MFGSQSVTPAPLDFDEILNTVKTGFSNVVKVVDAGLDIYASVPGRVEALKEISQDVKSSFDNPPPPPTVQDKASEFFKDNSGALTVGVIALLVVLAVKV